MEMIEQKLDELNKILTVSTKIGNFIEQKQCYIYYHLLNKIKVIEHEISFTEQKYESKLKGIFTEQKYDTLNIKLEELTTWNFPGPSGTPDCINIVNLLHPSPLLCGG